MSATVIKFEVYVTWPQKFDPAFTTFQAAIATLCGQIFYFQEATVSADGTNGQGATVYGLLNPSDAATALSLLGALNTGLTASGLGTARCISYNVTTQP